MSKAIFLDRDGTLIHDGGYTYKIEDFKLLPGVVEGLQLLSDYELFIVTNQSGIGRGYFSKDDFFNFNNHVIKELCSNRILIKATHYCPHKPDVGCDCRKPKTKLIDEIVHDYDIDISKSYVIGDHYSDVMLAKNAGCKSILVLTGHGKKHENTTECQPDNIANNFLDAVKFIKQAEKTPVIFTNGCFDIIHAGHVKLLEYARSLGGYVIVGLNSDDSVRRLKGSDRPINNQARRRLVLESIEYVDMVIIFYEDTPEVLIKKLKPDIIIKGNDYKKEDVVGGTFVESYGGWTSRIIQIDTRYINNSNT